MSEAPLRCAVIRGRLVVSIGIDTLAFAASQHDPWVVWDAERNDYRRRLKVTDAHEFAADIVRVLTCEAEDGTTVVHILFDNAALEAMEQGSLAVEECDEPFEACPAREDGEGR
jgi:hypothetical protein